MNINIVIITDELLFPHLLEILLYRKITDINLLVLCSLKEIDENLNSTACSLVLLDGGITKMSGLETIHHLRLNKLVVAPVWFFSEINTGAYIQKLKEMGASRIIEKPFDPHIITDEISLLFT